MKPNSFSTFELADLLLSQTSDWVLVRVHESYGVFENPDGEFLLTRSEIMEHLRRQGLLLTGLAPVVAFTGTQTVAEVKRIAGIS